MTLTPASFAVFAMDFTMRSRSAAGNPSSMMSPSERYFDSPPLTETSLTVPQTESFPISPPGKK